MNSLGLGNARVVVETTREGGETDRLTVNCLMLSNPEDSTFDIYDEDTEVFIQDYQTNPSKSSDRYARIVLTGKLLKDPYVTCQTNIEETPTGVWDATLPCPKCNQDSVVGYLLRNEQGEHMHTHYLCRFWASGTTKACGWHGWSVPGWDNQPDRQE